MIATGYTWIILMVLHSGGTMVHYTPIGTTEIQCKQIATYAPAELRKEVKYAVCVPKQPQI